MTQALAMPRVKRMVSRKCAPQQAERALRDIAYVLQLSGRLANEIRHARTDENRTPAPSWPLAS